MQERELLRNEINKLKPELKGLRDYLISELDAQYPEVPTVAELAKFIQQVNESYEKNTLTFSKYLKLYLDNDRITVFCGLIEEDFDKYMQSKVEGVSLSFPEIEENEETEGQLIRKISNIDCRRLFQNAYLRVEDEVAFDSDGLKDIVASLNEYIPPNKKFTQKQYENALKKVISTADFKLLAVYPKGLNFETFQQQSPRENKYPSRPGGLAAGKDTFETSPAPHYYYETNPELQERVNVESKLAVSREKQKEEIRAVTRAVIDAKPEYNQILSKIQNPHYRRALTFGLFYVPGNLDSMTKAEVKDVVRAINQTVKKDEPFSNDKYMNILKANEAVPTSLYSSLPRDLTDWPELTGYANVIHEVLGDLTNPTIKAAMQNLLNQAYVIKALNNLVEKGFDLPKLEDVYDAVEGFVNEVNQLNKNVTTGRDYLRCLDKATERMDVTRMLFGIFPKTKLVMEALASEAKKVQSQKTESQSPEISPRRQSGGQG